VRLIVVASLVVGCGGAAPRATVRAPAAVAPAASPASPGPSPPGAIRRVARAPEFGGYAGVWRHTDPNQDETLTIRGDGAFDWIIVRGEARCEIAGTTVIVDGVPPQLAWTMTLNTCNQQYQGKTSTDIVVDRRRDQDGFPTMSLQDAEFSEVPPVDYTRETRH